MPARTLAMALLLSVSTAIAGSLRGALIVAADGTFLGTCDGTYGTNSISNDYSRYGNKYSPASIFNEYGQYGSEYARYSAFNKLTMSAPYLLAASPELTSLFTSYTYRPTAGIVEALQSSGASRVSTNRNLVGAIDPNVLRVACETP